MSLPVLFRGENRLIVQPFFQKDRVTPLAVASFASLKLQLWQGGTMKGEFTLGTSPELRAGVAANEAVFELRSAFSQDLVARTALSFRWVTSIADAAFTLDAAFTKKKSVDVFMIE